jgi:hypothetical protein
MDDFIYLIALIAWVVFAFYRKSQKKSASAREAQREFKPQNESDPMSTLEEILLGKEPAVEAKPVPEPKAYTTDGIPPVLSETAFEKEYNLMGITSIEEMDKPLVAKKTKHTEKQDDEIFLEEAEVEDWMARVNLRQAVIYSEILNRPYV